MGSIVIGNNSTKVKCHYETVLSDAMKKAVDMGGNLIKITKVDSPAFISSCYRFRADVLLVADNSAYAADETAFEKWLGVQLQADTSHYAFLYVYMLKSSSDIYASYVVHSDVGNIGRVSDNTKYVTKVYKEGKLKIWSFTEKKAELYIDIKEGQSYYVKCLAKPGAVTGEPGFELMSLEKGKEEYEKIKK